MAKEKRLIAMKGIACETDNLGQQFKNLTFDLIKVLNCSKVIHGAERDRMRKFQKSCGALDEFRDVFKNKRVRDFCIKYFSSSYVVKKILESGKFLRGYLCTSLRSPRKTPH